MEWLSIKDAATRLGVSGSRVYQLRSAGVLARNEAGEVSAADVRTYGKVTHKAAMAKLGDRDRLALIAAGVRDRLHPRVPNAYPGTYGVAAIPLLAGDVVSALGFNCVTEAARPDRNGCRWCWSNITYRANGGVDPGDTAAYRALFASEPCPLDRKRWAAEADYRAAVQQRGAEIQAEDLAKRAKAKNDAIVAAAEARLKRDGAIVAAARARTVTVTRGSTVTASVYRDGEDDGSDLVAATRAKLLRLREAAIQRGDVRRVGEINHQIQGL